MLETTMAHIDPYLMETNTTEPEDGDEGLVWKISFLFILFAISIVFTLLPLLLKRPSMYSWLGIAKTFGGGVFLGMAFLNLLPELFELREPLEEDFHNEFPLGFFLAVSSYALLFAGVVLTSHMDGGHGHSHGAVHESDNEGVALLESGKSPLSGDTTKNPTSETGRTILTTLVLLLSLTFHGLMDGLVIGVQLELEDVIVLGIAIAAHKWAEALTYGIIIAKLPTKATSLYNLASMGLYFVSTPLGVAIGIGISENVSIIVTIIINAIAAGVFIFIAIHEILVNEFQKKSKNKTIKVMVMIFGIILMAILRATLPHHHPGDHDHDHGHGHSH